MNYIEPQPMPENWLDGCETEKEKQEREHEWHYWQCQKNKDYFRAVVHEIMDRLERKS